MQVQAAIFSVFRPLLRLNRIKNSAKSAVFFGLAALSLISAAQLGADHKSKLFLEGSDGPVGSVNGIDFDRFNPGNDNLYCASTVESKIFILNKHNGHVVDEFGPTNGLLGPDDVAVGPDGKIYFTDTLAGVIGRIDPITRTVTPLAFNLFLINSLRFSTDGTQLFAGQCFSPFFNGLWEIDLTGANNNRLISSTLDVFSSLNSFDYSNGAIYGPRIITGDVVRVDPVTGNVLGVVAAGFTNPSAVEFDSNGKLYVIDAFDNKLYRIDNPELNNQTPVLVAQLPGGSGVDNLAVDRSGNNKIYVSSGNDGYIVKVNPNNGNTIGYTKSSGIVLPTGITFTSQGQLLIGDFNSLREIDKHGIVKTTSTKIDITFSNPTVITRSLSIGSFGNNVVIGNWFDRVIQVWDHTNDVSLNRFTPLHRPLNVIEFQGTIVSAEFDSATSTGSLVQYSGPNFATSTTLLSLPFTGLTGLATDGSSIWMSDSIFGRIYKFDNGVLTIVATGLVGPEGIAFDNDGTHLYALEVGAKRLSVVDTQGVPGSNVTVVEDELPIGFTNGFSAPFFFVSNIAVDPQTNDIYFTCDDGREVRSIKN